MRMLIQCVKNASVTVESKLVSRIDSGELIFVGFKKGDDEKTADKMISKLLKLRIFRDSNGKTNLSINDVSGQILCVSQFTLYADLSEGNRPAFVNCMPPEDARKLFEYFSSALSKVFPSAKFGIFQADMKVQLLNDGPFTILLDSEELGYGN